MNAIWRFYQDGNQRWRWQRMSTDRTVVSECSKGHKEYDECVADAQTHGYVLEAAQPKLVGRTSR